MKLSQWLMVLCIVLAVGVAAGAGYLLGEDTGRANAVRSCAELGVAYLELGKRELGITDFGSVEWLALVEKETALVSDCTAFLAGRPMVRDLGQINSFEECAAAGFPVMESFPEQCMTPDGRNFVNEVQMLPEESRDSTLPQVPVACTMEAKVCPDGSAVGRSGPNCEFAPCPGE